MSSLLVSQRDGRRRRLRSVIGARDLRRCTFVEVIIQRNGRRQAQHVVLDDTTSIVHVQTSSVPDMEHLLRVDPNLVDALIGVSNGIDLI